MKEVVKLRVVLDHESNVFRDIEIEKDVPFSKLHDIIQEAFGFDNSQMASFYESNEEWEKGIEVTLMDVGEKDEKGDPILLMQNVQVEQFLRTKEDKMLYVFDFMLMWCFYIDVIEINQVDATVILPRITQSFGDAPEQYSKSGDLNFVGEGGNVLENDEDEEDLFGSLGIDTEAFDENDL